MAQILNRTGEEIYVLKSDRDLPADQQTGFMMGPVTYALRKQVVALINAGESFTPQWVDLLLKQCLRGTDPARPLRDEDGNPVPFRKTGGKKGKRAGASHVADSWLALLSQDQLTEIARDRVCTFAPELLVDDEGEEEEDVEFEVGVDDSEEEEFTDTEK